MSQGTRPRARRQVGPAATLAAGMVTVALLSGATPPGLAGTRASESDGAPAASPPPASAPADDFFRSTLVRELEATHVFLLSHRRGLPYTRDPRPLEPFAEVVRLQTDCQALGYLNLYRLTGKSLYLRQARERLDYILALGDAAFGHKHYDGQLGYGFLLAWELTGEPAYREAGLGIARTLLTYDNNVMNWGYLAAINLGRAFRVSGDARFLERARQVSRSTASRQFPDGAFSHRDGQRWGRNSPYTAWITFEMLLHRLDDPNDPDMDAMILRATRFLARRVDPDGRPNYEDAQGAYYYDPGTFDPRGWTSELPSLAYALRSVGRRDEARRVLEFLFRQEMRMAERGSYPDKWGFVDSTNIWMTGDPSILRTSLIFWLLSCVALQPGSPDDGVARPCAVTPTDCNAAFRELGLCGAGYAGVNTCIDGIFTGCMDESLVRYVEDATCQPTYACRYDSASDWSTLTTCASPGTRKCIGDVCGDTCQDIRFELQSCRDELLAGDRCPVAPAEARVAAAPGPPGVFRLEGVRPNPAAGALALAFNLAERGPVRAEVFDAAGRRLLVRELGVMTPGPHLVPLDGARLPGGVYLVRLGQGRRSATARAAVVP